MELLETHDIHSTIATAVATMDAKRRGKISEAQRQGQGQDQRASAMGVRPAARPDPVRRLGPDAVRRPDQCSQPGGHAEHVTTREPISSTKESDGFTKVSKSSRPQAPKPTTQGDITNVCKSFCGDGKVNGGERITGMPDKVIEILAS